MLDHTVERYDFAEEEPLGCCLTLTVEATFDETLSTRDLPGEVNMMAASCQSALQKLKLQAEHGVQAARAVETNLVL